MPASPASFCPPPAPGLVLWRAFRRRQKRLFRGLRLLGEARADLGKRVRLLEKLNWRLWPVFERVGRCHRSLTRPWQEVVVVTGSLGKTTATRALLAVFHGQAPDWTHAVNNCFSLVALNLMRQMPWRRIAVVEAGIGAKGQMERYAALLRPDMTVMTAVASDHARELGGLEGVWKEKVRMVRALPPDGVAVLNGDDPAVLRMAGETAARVATFGFSAGCTVRATGLAVEATGTRFILHAGGASHPVRTRLVGREAVRALVAAAAAGHARGLDLPEMIRRLAVLEPTPGRMQPFPLSNGAVVLADDFKGGWETVHAALDVLAEVRAARRVLVLGELFEPPRPRVARYVEVGAHAARVADRILLFGKWSRLYRRGLGDALPAEALTDVGSIAGAVEVLRQEVGAGDVVLLKGRGEHKLCRIALELSGVEVGCRIAHCRFENLRCPACPRLSVPSGLIA